MAIVNNIVVDWEREKESWGGGGGGMYVYMIERVHTCVGVGSMRVNVCVIFFFFNTILFYM